MGITTGLYGYEIVLLILGVVLFLVLIFAFLYQILHGKKVSALLAFFVLPIAMIGYPSIHSLQYKDGVLTLEKSTQDLLKNPLDAAARAKVEQEVSDLSKRPAKDPKDATIVAKAQFAVGDESGAAQTLNGVLQKDPNYAEALQLRNKMELVHQLEELATRVTQNPSDQQARTQLQQTVAVANNTPISNPNALVHLARAQSLLGQNQDALKTIDKAAAIRPNAVPVQKVKREIASRAAEQ